MGGWYSLFYLLESSFFAGSLHPMAAHFIAEHYLFGGIEQETWSYYGGLNWLAYNVSLLVVAFLLMVEIVRSF